MIILLIGDESKCKNHVNVMGLRDIRSDSSVTRGSDLCICGVYRRVTA